MYTIHLLFHGVIVDIMTVTMPYRMACWLAEALIAQKPMKDHYWYEIA